MVLKLVQQGNSLPYFWPVDPTANLEPGMIAQLKTYGNQIVCGVSDGRAPIGIIDDVKTTAFTAPSTDEIVILNVENPSYDSSNRPVLPYDVKVELENPNISSSSFVTNPVSVTLNPRNGVITFLAGTLLNYDQTGSGVPDSIRTKVSYIYQIPNVVGDDSTAGNGRVTVWFDRMIFQTDQYDTSCRYPINASLFVNEQGKLTTRRISAEEFPAVAIVTAPPTSGNSFLECLWL